MDHPFTYRRENGFVLVVSLGAVVIAAVLILLYLSFTQQTEQAARKRQYQDRGEESIEIGMISLRDALTEQFQRNAQVEISDWFVVHCQRYRKARRCEPANFSGRSVPGGDGFHI
jgi:hypothetical protein